MTRIAPLFAVLFGYACSVLAQTGDGVPSFQPVPEPENHAVTVDRLIRYHDSGEYDSEIRQVVNAAREYLRALLAAPHAGEKLAAVFDVDETSLSNWDAMFDCGFCAHKLQLKLYPNVHAPAIVPVLELYNFAKSNGIALFFVTGRSNDQKDLTAKNLQEAGYNGWADLIMRPTDNKDPARIFKSRSRQEITNKGYRITMNIGDQASDLAGCCAERVFKLPNPFYLLP